MSAIQSSLSTPFVTSALGCNTFGAYRLNPRLSSLAPYTTRDNCAHPHALAHIGHGSMVTYKVQSVRYFPVSYTHLRAHET